MGATERLTIPLPYGQRTYVVSDLELNPKSDPTSRPIRELVELLNEIDDAAVVIVAGNFFFPSRVVDTHLFLTATWERLSELRVAITRFASVPHRRFVVLPGCHDGELIRGDIAEISLATSHIELARDVIVQVATSNGTRDLAVAVGRVPREEVVVDLSDQLDAQHLEDPRSLARFAASRLLYRRLTKWMWFPLWALVLLDAASSLVELASRITHHHWRIHATRPGSVWTTILLDLLIIAAFEAVLAAVATFVVGRRFAQRTTTERTHHPADPLAVTLVDNVHALEVARRVAERGGAGAVIGGAPRPALVFLDHGMCVSPGPSREAVIERRAMFGLPPVFTAVARLGVVEIEAASSVRVRLIAGESAGTPATRLERWLATTPREPSPLEQSSVIGSWPTGEPWPLAGAQLRALRHRRNVRRVASGLLFLTGLADIIVAAAPPLRGRFHAAISILPIGVLQGAVAVTAIAGFAMIMMARGVRRGQRRAWLVAVLMLLVTIVTHLARGGSVAGSILAVLVLGLLLFERESFMAATDRASLRATVPRLSLIGLVAVVASTIGIELSGRHGHQLASWPKVIFACVERMIGVSTVKLPEKIDDFVSPVMLSLGVALVVTTLYLITRPVVDRRLSQHASPTERRIAELRARDIVKRHGRGTLDYFALRDDKQFFFHRDSLVAYAVYGGVSLLSPDPIGPVSERAEVLSAFRAFSEQRGWTLGVIGASEEWLPIYQSAGLHHIYLGDEAVVDCPSFSLQGGKMKGLRQACTRLARNGYTVEYYDPATINPSEVNGVIALIAKLRRGEGERGFSMMLGRLFDPRDQGLLLTVVKDANGVPAAVCQFVPSPAINGYSLDLMRRDPDEHPNGLIDYALCSTIAHLAAQGASGVSLNFAAFRTVLDGEKADSTMTRIERWALKRLSGFLPIESLWSFNAKYDPGWQPRYIIYPAAESFVPVVAAILRAESITEIPVLGRFLASECWPQISAS